MPAHRTAISYTGCILRFPVVPKVKTGCMPRWKMKSARKGKKRKDVLTEMTPELLHYQQITYSERVPYLGFNNQLIFPLSILHDM